MKPSFRFHTLLVASSIIAASPLTHSETYYWDNDGSTAGFGTASGTWAAPTTNNGTQGWSTDSTGSTLPTGTTSTSASDTVNFGSSTAGLSAGSITVSGTVNVGNIIFGSGAATTPGTVALTGGTISIASGGTISNNSSSTFQINSVLAGSGGFTVNNSGSGSLQFNGSNITHSGAMTIQAGSVLMANTSYLGSLSKVVLDGSTARMRFNVSNNVSSTKAFDLTANGGTISKGGNGTLGLSGAFTSTGTGNRTLTLYSDGNGAATLSGSFLLADPSSGKLSLRKTGTGTWILSAANTFSGTTTVTGGELRLSSQPLALQNSVIDTTNSIANFLVLPSTTTLTLGGLDGNKDFNAGNGTGIFISSGSGFTNLTALTLNPGAGTSASFSGIIGIGNGSMTLTKRGLGTQILSSSSSTYTGVTTIQAGTLIAGASAPASGTGVFGNASSAIVLGNGNTGVSDAPTLLINGAFDIARAVTVGSISNTAAYNATIGGSNTTGTSTFSGNITLNTTAANYTTTLQAAAGGTVDFTGTWTTNNKAIAIGSSGNTGTVKLTSSVSTSGGISVNFGTLNVAGGVTSNVTVNSGGTLGGIGTITGNLTVNEGGAHHAGNSPGIQTVNGDYVLNGELGIEIEGLTAGNGAGFHDQVIVNGVVTLGASSTLSLESFSGFTPVNGDLIFILLNNESDAINGTFSGLAQGATVGNYLGFDWQISYVADSTGGTFTGGNDIALMAIPEPKAALLGALGVMLLFRRRR